MDTTVTEILKPSTLKYMHNVHWTDPDWETTWGLGFVVYKGPDGSKWVSHGGSCPGYRSTLTLNPKSKMAFSVMINASGTSPGKYASSIYEILSKVKVSKENISPEEKTKNKNLLEYVGYYSSMPWGGELYFSTWEGKLVGLGLPTESPANSMSFYKHIEGDTFCRIRDNGELGEAIVFERDSNGKITQFKRNGNYTKKIIK